MPTARRHRQPLRHSYFANFLALLIAGCAAFAALPRAADAAERPAPLNVLVLSSWFQDLPWQRAFDAGLQDGLEESGRPYNLYVEFLDAGRFPEEQQRDALAAFLRGKYRGKGIDVVIAESIPAVRFLIDNPDLFGGVRRLYIQTGAKLDKVKASQTIISDVDYEAAVAEMVRLARPKHIYVIGDTNNKSAEHRLKTFKAALDAKAAGIDAEFLSDLAMDALLAKVSHLPEDSVIFCMPIFKDGKDGRLTPRKGAGIIAARANAPVFSAWETMLGTGILGGFMLSSERIGRLAAMEIARAAGDEIAATSRDTHGYYYDWRQLRRWQIDEARLPADANVLYRDPSVFDRYRWQILGAIAFIVVETLLILVLLRLNAQKRKAEREVRALNENLEARVEARTAELRAANNDLTAFAYSVAHDFRAPLRAVHGFGRILVEDHAAQLDDDGRDFLHRMVAASERMGALIDDLLALSRITRAELHRGGIDMSAMAEEIVQQLREADPDRKVTVDIAPGVRGEGDSSLVRIALENLIGNAWKFTSKTADACISFGAETDRGEPGFFVRDNGAGFDMTYAGKIFEAFQRLHKEDEFPGTGIGLANVMQVVRKHGGHVWAEGKVGEGACFHFTLTPA
jgi:signal transduction histidine kinase